MCKTPVPTFHCPTRRAAKLYPSPYNGTFIAYNANNNDPNNNVLSRCDYAICCGSSVNIQPTGGGPTSYSDGKTFDWPACSDPHSSAFQSGLSYIRSVVTPAQITRGQAHVIMLGEKGMDPLHYTDGMDGGDNESLYVGQDNDNFRTTNSPPVLDQAGVANPISFGSSHVVGSHFVFGDGSVHLVSYDVNATVFLAWGIRNSRQVGDINVD
jgi:hypothetical protein